MKKPMFIYLLTLAFAQIGISGGGTVILDKVNMEKALTCYDQETTLNVSDKTLTPIQPFDTPDGRQGLVTFEGTSGDIFTLVQIKADEALDPNDKITPADGVTPPHTPIDSQLNEVTVGEPIGTSTDSTSN